MLCMLTRLLSHVAQVPIWLAQPGVAVKPWNQRIAVLALQQNSIWSFHFSSQLWNSPSLPKQMASRAFTTICRLLTSGAGLFPVRQAGSLPLSSVVWSPKWHIIANPVTGLTVVKSVRMQAHSQVAEFDFSVSIPNRVIAVARL